MIDTVEVTTVGPRERSRVWRALTSPSTLVAVLRAKIALRKCDSAPWGIRLRGRVRVENYGGLRIGERVRIEARTVPVELVSWRGPLTVGEGTFINYGTSISAHESVSIGRDCLIGNYVLIMDSDYHDLRDRSKPGIAKAIVIEDNVWIGARAIVLKGVHIGEGAVVAAGAIVVNDVPARTVVANEPAKVVRTL
ncbi:MAG TPA: DapH/DapD/GlmU-related protein [Dehalococcoidia bacterium]